MPQKTQSTNRSATEERYKAPALRKGLEILELLASADSPLTTPEIAMALGRTSNELFRMLQVLEAMEYIARPSSGEGFEITRKLFKMGMEQPRFRHLAELGYPIMRRLCDTIGQSCHLVVPSQDQIVVVARVESEGEIVMAVRVGYRRSIATATSGSVLFAFQPKEVQEKWLALLRDQQRDFDATAFVERATRIRRRGYAKIKSKFARGVTDVSAPVLRDNVCEAALTVPFFDYLPLPCPISATVAHVRNAAVELSEALSVIETRDRS